MIAFQRSNTNPSEETHFRDYAASFASSNRKQTNEGSARLLMADKICEEFDSRKEVLDKLKQKVSMKDSKKHIYRTLKKKS